MRSPLKAQDGRRVAKLLALDADFLQESHVQIVHWCFHRIPQNAPALERTGSAYQHQREINMRMRVGITDTTSVENQGVIEQTAIALRSCLQFAEEIRQQLHMVLIDLMSLLELHRVILMVRDSMM